MAKPWQWAAAACFQGAPPPISADLETQGKTLLFVIRNGRSVGVLAAMDTLRPDRTYPRHWLN